MTRHTTKIAAAELAGTFGLVVAATGSVEYDASLGFSLGPVFVAFAHFAGLSILVMAFGRYSMAHFNPAVTLGFALSGYVKPRLIPIYLAAQSVGAILGSLFVYYTIGNHANLGVNAPGPGYAVHEIFAVEIMATVFLMGGILLVLGVQKNPMVVSVTVGAIVALDVFFLAPISGASMNPIRSLAPALVSGIHDHLWLYWTAPFVGSAAPAAAFAKWFKSKSA